MKNRSIYIHNNTNGNLNINNIFNPAIFVSSITDNISYSVAKDSGELIMNLRLPQIATLFIYVSDLLLRNTTAYSYNEYLLYLIKDVCLYRLINGHSNKPKSNMIITY